MLDLDIGGRKSRRVSRFAVHEEPPLLAVVGLDVDQAVSAEARDGRLRLDIGAGGLDAVDVRAGVEALMVEVAVGRSTGHE